MVIVGTSFSTLRLNRIIRHDPLEREDFVCDLRRSISRRLASVLATPKRLHLNRAQRRGVISRVSFWRKVLYSGLDATPTSERSPSTVLKHPSAFLPVAMSLGVLAIVLMFVALHGTAPQADEGAAAHIWQLLMAAQVPIVLFFAIKWLPQSPRQAMPILGLQAGAALAAMAPIFLLHW